MLRNPAHRSHGIDVTVKGTRLLAALLATHLVACGGGEPEMPPELISYEIVEGYPEGYPETLCSGCPLVGPRLGPGPDGALSLRLDTGYTVRVNLRTGGRRDRCIYKMVGFSWETSGHDFYCQPVPATSMQQDYLTKLSSFAFIEGRSYRITMSLAEYETEARRELSRQDFPDIPVRFVR
jgi:hypothetical protein